MAFVYTCPRCGRPVIVAWRDPRYVQCCGEKIGNPERMDAAAAEKRYRAWRGEKKSKGARKR